MYAKHQTYLISVLYKGLVQTLVKTFCVLQITNTLSFNTGILMSKRRILDKMPVKIAQADKITAGFGGRMDKMPVSEHFLNWFNFTVNPNILTYFNLKNEIF